MFILVAGVSKTIVFSMLRVMVATRATEEDAEGVHAAYQCCNHCIVAACM
jgi:uncharacterized protein YwlG (UPF0340 family)